MFIREVKKQRSKNSKTFFQYNLVQTSRVEGKVKQRVILYLGSDPMLKDKDNRSTVLQILKANIFNQPGLFPPETPQPLRILAESYFQKYEVKYGTEAIGRVSLPPKPDKADYHRVDIEGLEVEDVRTFGGEHLCHQILEKLQLKECLLKCGVSSKEADKALISIAARALFASSEHKTAQILATNSELQHCFGFNETISHRALYSASDTLYKHKSTIDTFLYQRLSHMFELNDKLVIFDISNTYFETTKRKSKLAKHGRSKEKRSDCPLVVFTGVIDSCGFIRHSRIYEGNKTDSGTLADMLSDLDKHTHSQTKPTVVMDAGIATEENLKLITEKGYRYVCVSRHQLKAYEIADEKQLIVQPTNRNKEEVKLGVFQPKGFSDTWMYVQSDSKRKKEQSIDEKLSKQFEQEIDTIKNALHKKGGTKLINKVWERIGRLKERNKRVSAKYEIDLEEENGKATNLTWEKKPLTKPKDDKANGVYFIRTNHQNPDEAVLWQIYNTIREVESTFRCLKSDLQIRPVHHQNDERIEAHLYLTILSYQMVNTIRHMIKKKGINYDWKNITRIMSTQTIQTIVLPTDTKNIHLRKIAKPIKQANEIYKAAACEPSKPTVKKYVVYH